MSSHDFQNLKEFTDYIKNELVTYISSPDNGYDMTHFLADPQFVWTFIYGSMVYHPHIAKDYDVCVVLSEDMQGIFSDVFGGDGFDSYTFNGLPVDVKQTSFGDLDASELLELQYALDTEATCYDPVVLKMSHMYLYYDSMKVIVPMALAEKQKVRHSISQKCSNSFVKAKKKLTVAKDYDKYSSMKSLFHSIRMAVFAYQYAKNGIIIPHSCSDLYNEIVDDYRNHTDEELLELINTKYKKIYNEKLRLFRLFYPK